jgi:hypothetical protein
MPEKKVFFGWSNTVVGKLTKVNHPVGMIHSVTDERHNHTGLMPSASSKHEKVVPVCNVPREVGPVIAS